MQNILANQDSNGRETGISKSNCTEYSSHESNGKETGSSESNCMEYSIHDSNGRETGRSKSNCTEYSIHDSNGRETGSSESNCTEYISHDSNGRETGNSESNCTEYRRNDLVCGNNEDSDSNNVDSHDAIRTDFQSKYETGVRDQLQPQSEESVEVRKTSYVTIPPYPAVVWYGIVDDQHSSIYTSTIAIPRKTMLGTLTSKLNMIASVTELITGTNTDGEMG